MEKEVITVENNIYAPVGKVWQYWTSPEHIVNWNSASDGWHTPSAMNDLREQGKFCWRMEAKDGSAGFDFEGVYGEIVERRSISYTLGDGRKVNILFEEGDDVTFVREHFEAESTHSPEMQKQGWQAILNNFKNYVERRELRFKDEPLG